MEDSEVHLPVAAITPYLCFSVLDFVLRLQVSFLVLVIKILCFIG